MAANYLVLDTMIRRNYLKVMGGAVLGSSMLSGTAVADYTRSIDVVADLGVDNTGATAIDDDLKPYLNDGVLLEFPDGQYRIDQLILYGLTNFGMRATGSASLVPGDYPTDGQVWIGGGGVRDFLFEGFTIDTTGDVGPTIGFSAYDGLVVRDIEKVGAHGTHRTAFGFSIWDPNGSGLVENLRATDGDIYPDTVGANAIYTKTEGTLTFKNCEVAGWGDNGLYASDATGPVQVEGGYYANNNISQVRLSSPGSYVHGATIEVDQDRGGERNMRGVRVCTGPGPVDVVDCDIRMIRGQGSGGVVTAFDGGTVNVRNSRIFVGEDYTRVGSNGTRTSYGILVDEATGIDDPGTHLVEGTSITGGGNTGSAILFRRGNTEIRGSCINQTGTRDGIVFDSGSKQNAVDNTTVSVSQAPFVTNGASVTKTVISYAGSCPLPSSIDYQEYVAPTLDIADAPLPGDASRIARPIMGTAKQNPTAVLFGNYTDPGMASFAQGNLVNILHDFVTTGALDIQVRMIPASADEELLVQTGLAVWDKEPQNFWPFFAYVLTNQSTIDYTSVSGVRDILKAVGVRNYGWLPWLAYDDAYGSLVDDDVAAVGSLISWSDYPPLLEFDGDFAAPQYVYDGGIKSWLEQRL